LRPDTTTLKDLSFLTQGGESIFTLIDFTTTQRGRDALRKHILHPPGHYSGLVTLQDSIRYLATHPQAWTPIITNGTLVMLEKFFESADSVATPPSGIGLLFGNFFLRLFNRQEYFFTQFSISHLSDFLKGCLQLTKMLDDAALPEGLRKMLEEMQGEMDALRLVPDLTSITKDTPYKEITRLSFTARREMKTPVYRLMQQYALLDAWQSMARATTAKCWTYPKLQDSFPLTMQVEGLYHPLLQQPVSYDMQFDQGRNFLLLTGANMSGKTTFMRALGVCALLAHLGMGVPAQYCTISFLQGVVTNMHIEDNLLRGESYFFAEVQRMKMTAGQLLQPLPHLVLMDELFKGTNVHDAYECTRAVLDGLLKHRHHIMVLSTHLYEVAQEFSERRDIQFAYFVTSMRDDNSYAFSYELRSGISSDRIGYRILQREGVIDLLNQVKG
jgi:DNA mismatch repair protein MutS